MPDDRNRRVLRRLLDHHDAAMARARGDRDGHRPGHEWLAGLCARKVAEVLDTMHRIPA